MKAIRIAALGVALVLGSTVASAQGGPPAGAQQQGQPGRGGNRPNQLMAGIELTADQQAKMAEIQAKYAPEMQAIRDLMATDRPGAMKKRADLNAKMQPEQRAVLTAEQQAVFDKNAAAAKARADSIAKAAPPAI